MAPYYLIPLPLRSAFYRAYSPLLSCRSPELTRAVRKTKLTHATDKMEKLWGHIMRGTGREREREIPAPRCYNSSVRAPSSCLIATS